MKYWRREGKKDRYGAHRAVHKVVFLLSVLSFLSSTLPMLVNVDYTTIYVSFPLFCDEPRVYYVTALGRLPLGGCIRSWHFGEISVYKVRLDSKGVDRLAGDERVLGIYSPEDAESKFDLMKAPYTVTTSAKTSGVSDYKQYHRRTDRYAGEGVTVCVIDTGIDYLHPDFFREGGESVIRCMVSMFFIGNNFTYVNWVPGVNGTLEEAWALDQEIFAAYGMYAWMDENGHGTHVAGIIAGQGNMGFVGLAPGVDLVIVKAFDRLGVAGLDIVLEALEWVYNNTGRYGIRIVNISWGSTGDNRGIDPLSLLVDYMTEELGIVFVCAMGNEGNVPFTVNIPACARRAVAVGAFDVANKKIAEFSSFGTTIDLRMKPDFIGAGVGIISCKPVTVRSYIEEEYPDAVYNDYYMVLSGTSMATPCVASVYAAYIERLTEETSIKPTPTALYNVLVGSCERINKYGQDFVSGWGIPVISER